MSFAWAPLFIETRVSAGHYLGLKYYCMYTNMFPHHDSCKTCSASAMAPSMPERFPNPGETM